MKNKPSIPKNEDFLSILRGSMPTETCASGVEAAWIDAARLAKLVRLLARAGTSAKAVCGIILRALREHYFGPRNAKGGRPRQRAIHGEFGSWNEMLLERVGISDDTATNWMRIADAVERIAEHTGMDIRAICEKLPWDWTPEESAMVESIVYALCEDRTQREILQNDFLSDLGYAPACKPNSSNNPFGKNGGKKKQVSATDLLRERQEAARILFCGTARAGRVGNGSVAMFFTNCVNNGGKDLESLPQAELRNLYENIVKPFADAFRKLAEQ